MRVARNASAHRGLKYRKSQKARRIGDRRIRWPRIRIPGIDVEWTAEIAYAIGLLATDGCLSGGKTVALTSNDHDLIEIFKHCVGAEAPIGRNGRAYRVQVTDVQFFRWLDSIGVTPRKSLTLGALDVPRDLMVHTIRGLFDGDGSIYTGFTTPNRRRYPNHRYQRLQVRFHSASERHITWLRELIRSLVGLDGWVTKKRKPAVHKEYAELHVLRYSKLESRTLLEWIYEDPTAPRLDRKWRKWTSFRDHGMKTRPYRRAHKAATIESRAGVAESAIRDGLKIR